MEKLKTAPTLALAIPAYNAAWCLPRLLQSAQNQTIPFDEILVYDDCSTDNTAEVAAQYGAKVYTGKVNVGCSAGKNFLLEKTRCTHIHFHDADDELLSNFTRLAHQWFANPNCPDVVLFNYEYRENDSHALIANSRFDDALLRQDAIRYAILHQINPFCGVYDVAKLRAIGGYDTQPEILYNEDVAFHCKLAIAGFTFGAEKEISIINYRVGGSMSAANALKCARAHHEVMRMNEEKVGDRYAAEIAQKLWSNAVILASLGDWEYCKKSLALIKKLKAPIPSDERMYIKILGRISPYWAILFREYMIRLFKPWLRH